jgi:hypothetical protein
MRSLTLIHRAEHGRKVHSGLVGLRGGNADLKGLRTLYHSSSGFENHTAQPLVFFAL